MGQAWRTAVAAILLTVAALAGASAELPRRFDGLVKSALPMVREFLETHGEFAPFGLAADARGAVTTIESSGAHGLRNLRESLATERRSSRADATALVYPATLTEPASIGRQDAIAVELTHRSGSMTLMVFPFRFDGAEPVIEPPRVVSSRSGAGKGWPSRGSRVP